MIQVRNPFWRYLATVGVLTLVYLGGAKLADWVTSATELAPPVWPPAGIAQAALLLLGTRMGLGVWLGAFLAALSAGTPWLVAGGIALGSTLQALLGTVLARSWGIHPSLKSLRDVSGFILWVVPLSTLISPTLSLVSLLLGGQLETGEPLTQWWTGWLGNAVGVLIITPVLLTWCFPRSGNPDWQDGTQIDRSPHFPKPSVLFNWGDTLKQLVLFVIWLVSLLMVSALVFGARSGSAIAHYPLVYLSFPFIIWAALQFGQRSSVLGTLIVSGSAIWGVVMGRGPFVTEGRNLMEAILLLQVFMSAVAVTALVLAATVRERNAAEDSLRASEMKYRSIFENAVEGIYQITPGGRYLSANPALARMYGYRSPKELMACLADIGHQLYTDPKRHEALTQQLRNCDRLTGFESQIYRQDGSTIWIAENVQAVRDARGQLLYYEGAVEDITARKQAQEELNQKNSELEQRVQERTAVLRKLNQQLLAEVVDNKQVQQALRESEERYRSVVNALKEVIFQTDTTGAWTFLNPAWTEITGFAVEESLGKVFLDYVHPDDRQRNIEAFQPLMAGKKNDCRHEIRYLTQQGDFRWIEVNAQLIRDADGAIAGMSGTLNDITERKQTEEQLRASQQRLSLLVQQTPLAVIEWNLDGEIVDWNPAAQAIFGYDKAEALGHSSDLIVPDVAVERVEQVKQELWSGTGGIRSCNENVTKDGRRIICEWYNTPLIDEQGNLLGAASMALDITERERAQRALQESEERFALAIQANDNGLFDVNLKTGDYYYSPQFLDLIGYSPEQENPTIEELIELVHPEDVETVRATMDALSAGRISQWQLEFRMFHSNGSVPWLLSRGLVMRDEAGQSVRMVGTHTDISDRKQAEFELRRQTLQRQLFAEITLKIRQSLQLESILQTTVTEVRRILQVDRVVVYQLQLDGSGTVLTEAVAPEWSAILGQTIDDPCFARDYLQHYRQGRIRAIDNLRTADIRACQVDMLQQFDVRASLVVPILQRETLWGLLIAHQCASPRQWRDFEIELLRQLADQVGIALAQSQLLEQETATSRQLAEQNLHLEQIRRDAEAANRAKSEFLANMSHELRTPLNGILGYAQILKRNANLSPKQQQGLAIIQQCGEHLLTLLNDILDLSKIEARKMDLCLDNFQLHHFLEGIVAIFGIHAEQKNIFFHYETLSDLPKSVRGDEKRLRQVLINLLGNAIKFTDVGGVTLKVGYVARNCRGREAEEQEDNSPCPMLHAQSPKMRFIVEDTGIGIAPERLVEIFLPFHQIRDKHHHFEGTGLGLAISQKLIKLMGGELQVKSALGQGSTFWFDLDLPEVTQGEERVEIGESAITGFRGSQRKILIADENWENRSILVSFLAPVGFDVAEASDGRDCLEQALAWQPDAILLNPVLPVVNGLEVVRRIRQLPVLQDVTILATSASVFDDNQQACLRAGCDGFIPQPVQTQNLFEQLRKHLELEWIYEQSDRTVPLDVNQIQQNSPADGFASAPEGPQEATIAPPPSEMGTLYELAMMGDIAGIIEQAEHLERQDAQLIPFARQLRQLAKGFQEKQILEFVQKYVKDSP